MTETAADALARLYDLDLSEDPGDLDLYLALAGQTGGPILELAVGSGRLAVPLAAAGYDVTGVDLDRAMLARARAAADAAGIATARRLELVHADAREVRLPAAGSFQLAFIPLNSLFLMGTRADQAAAVATLAAHLAPGWPGGRRLLAPGRRGPRPLRRPRRARVGPRGAGDRPDGDQDRQRDLGSHDEHRPPDHRVRGRRPGRARGPLGPGRQPALVGPDELVAMAEAAGLRVEALAGDYDLGPLELGAERVVLLARRS